MDTLISQTRNVLTRFLKKPLSWNPDNKITSDDEKIAIIDRMKQIVNEELTELSKSRPWKSHQIRWQDDYEPSGSGSTTVRKQRVHELFLHQVPVPQLISDREAQAWIDQVKHLLMAALEILQKGA